jgi:hypothetical protein
MKRYIILILTCIWTIFCFAQNANTADSNQSSEWLCGPKCLNFLCQRFKIDSNVDELSRLSNCDENRGTTLLGLYQAATAKGLQAMGAKLSVDELASLKIPAIAHFWSNHFVVVEGAPGGLIKVTDTSLEPATIILIDKEEFGKLYSGFALLVSTDAAAFPQSATVGADLRVDNYTWDFGTVNEDVELTHTFIVTNKGNEDLIISKVNTSSDSTIASPSQVKVAPNAHTTLTATVDTKHYSGQLGEMIFIYSNDKVTPVIQLGIQGVVRPSKVPIWPREINLGEVSATGSVSQDIYVSKLSGDTLRVESVNSDNPFIIADLDGTTSNQQSVNIISVKLKPEAPVGKISGTVAVHTNHPTEPIVYIPVTATITGDIHFSPTTAFFGCIKRGNRATIEVTISNKMQEPLEIEKIESESSYILVNKDNNTSDNHRSIIISVSEDAPSGYLNTTVVVYTNNHSQPRISIPVYAFVTSE